MTALLEAARYAGASARVHALFARLISEAEWSELLNSADVPALLSLLQPTWYAPSLSSLAGRQADPVQLERDLTRHWAWASRLPLILLSGASRSLMEWYWRRQELSNVKTLLRALHHQRPPEQVASALIPLGSACELPWATLATANSIPDLIERLRNTWYGKTLQNALEQYRRQQTVFVLEVALDLDYYRRLRKLLDQLHGRDREYAEAVIGFWINAQNLLWAYRYRIYAQLSPEEILNYTLQRNLHVNADTVRAIALGAPLWEMVQQLWPRLLPELLPIADLPERDALPTLELLFLRHLFDWAVKIRGTAALHLGAVLAYEVLLESEVRDLVTTVESKRLRWSSTQLQPYLIRSQG